MMVFTRSLFPVIAFLACCCTQAQSEPRNYCPVFDGSVSHYLSTQVIHPFRDDFENGTPNPKVWMPLSIDASITADSVDSGLILSGSFSTSVLSITLLSSQPIRADRGTITITFQVLESPQSGGLFADLVPIQSPSGKLKPSFRTRLDSAQSDTTHSITIRFDAKRSRIAEYCDDRFIRELVCSLPSEFRLEISAEAPEPHSAFQMKLLRLSSDLSITRWSIPVTTSIDTIPTDNPNDIIMHYNMDNGAKYEWFLRRQTADGFLLFITQSEGLGPDGLRHVYKVDPPVLLWKWPVHKGETWEENPELIIDDSQRISTRSKVEILDIDSAVVLPEGSFRDVMKLSVTYFSNLGVDVSTFHIGNGIGMLREEQITNDGRTLLTEFLTATYYTPLASPTIDIDRIHSCGPFSLDVSLSDVRNIEGFYLCAFDPTRNITCFFCEDGGGSYDPCLIPIPLPPQSGKALTLRFDPDVSATDIETLIWTAVSVDASGTGQMSRPCTLFSTSGPCSGTR